MAPTVCLRAGGLRNGKTEHQKLTMDPRRTPEKVDDSTRSRLSGRSRPCGAGSDRHRSRRPNTTTARPGRCESSRQEAGFWPRTRNPQFVSTCRAPPFAAGHSRRERNSAERHQLTSMVSSPVATTCAGRRSLAFWSVTACEHQREGSRAILVQRDIRPNGLISPQPPALQSPSNCTEPAQSELFRLTC